MRMRRRVMAATWKGKVIAKKWPRARGKPKSKNQIAWVNRFSQMACISALADARARNYADGISKGTLWFWRDLVTKAMLGQFLRSEGEQRVTTPTAMVQRLAPVSIGPSSDTIVTPDTELWDTNNFWNPMAPTEYLTARSAGLYLVGINLQWATSTTGQRTLRLAINGVNYEAVTQAGQASTNVFQNVITICYLHAGDLLRCSVRQNSSAGINVILNHFFIMGISPETIIP